MGGGALRGAGAATDQDERWRGTREGEGPSVGTIRRSFLFFPQNVCSQPPPLITKTHFLRMVSLIRSVSARESAERDTGGIRRVENRHHTRQNRGGQRRFNSLEILNPLANFRWFFLVSTRGDTKCLS